MGLTWTQVSSTCIYIHTSNMLKNLKCILNIKIVKLWCQKFWFSDNSVSIIYPPLYVKNKTTSTTFRFLRTRSTSTTKLWNSDIFLHQKWSVGSFEQFMNSDEPNEKQKIVEKNKKTWATRRISFLLPQLKVHPNT